MPSEPSVPLMDVPNIVTAQLAGFGAPSAATQARLYRALANQPDLLAGWVELAWRLRKHSKTPRRLRELMIVRGMEIATCDSELFTHQGMAREAGVSDDELRQLANWRTLPSLSEPERAALGLMEAMASGSVPDEVNDELARHFTASERVELILTGGMYAMVPRVLDALRLSKRPA